MAPLQFLYWFVADLLLLQRLAVATALISTWNPFSSFSPQFTVTTASWSSAQPSSKATFALQRIYPTTRPLKPDAQPFGIWQLDTSATNESRSRRISRISQPYHTFQHSPAWTTGRLILLALLHYLSGLRSRMSGNVSPSARFLSEHHGLSSLRQTSSWFSWGVSPLRPSFHVSSCHEQFWISRTVAQDSSREAHAH